MLKGVNESKLLDHFIETELKMGSDYLILQMDSQVIPYGSKEIRWPIFCLELTR